MATERQPSNVATTAAVFLSYAREDTDAARRIADALGGSGIEVWFDQRELRGGDAWDQKIRGRIKDCTLFLPLISAHTESRGEGYFRLEWKLADERTHLMAKGVPFLVPLVADDTADADAMVPDSFRAVQWTRLSGGVPTPEFVAHIKRLLEAPRRATHSAVAGGSDPAPARPTGRSPAGDGPPSVGFAKEGDPALQPKHRVPVWTWTALAVAVVVLGVLVYVGRWPAREAPAASLRPEVHSTPASTPVAPDPKSIAVLPFENMSADKENAYLCDGIQEDILTNLGNIADLRVTSRTSVIQYRESTKPIRQISQELGVKWILEGSVQREGNKVRVTGQLINAQTDDHVWAKAYDRDLTDIFAIQTEIAQAIAAALQAKLSPEEQRQVAHRPTSNAEAYDLYLQARGLSATRRSIALCEEQATLLERAVALDPNFAEAWADLACVHARFIDHGFDTTARRRERADSAIAQALRLAPDSPEVIRAMGEYAVAAYGDDASARQQYEKLLRLRPNDPTVYAALSDVDASARHWADAIATARRAAALDPSNRSYSASLEQKLCFVRHWAEATAEEKRWLTLHPDDHKAQFELARLQFYATGDTTGGRAFFSQLKPAEAASPDMIFMRKAWDYQTGDIDHFLALDRQMPDHPDYIAADNPERMAFALVGALANLNADQRPAAEARAAAVEAQARAQATREPTNAQAWTTLGLAAALFGDKAEAVRAAKRAIELKPELGAWRLNLAIVKAWVGDRDGALADLKRLLSTQPASTIFVEGWLNVHAMRTSPAFTPLRGDSRFEALLNDPKNNAPLF